MVTSGLGRTHSRAELPGRNDSRTSLLHSGNEDLLQPLVVVDDLWCGFAPDGGVAGVGELGGRVVAPDDAVLHLRGEVKLKT